MDAKINQVLDFWFKELHPDQWWAKDENLDQEIKKRFLSLHQSAKKGELYHWRSSTKGRLAEILVLDQFSRNIFRGKKESFDQDVLALVLSQEMINQKMDQQMSPTEKSFVYLPYMHSESLKIHEVAMKLYNQPGLEFNFDFEKKHKVIIDQFGRYPHRNEILGRTSTPEELEFLKSPGSSF